MLPTEVAKIEFEPPPRVPIVLALSSLLLIGTYALLAGVLVRVTIRTTEPLEGFVELVGTLILAWMAWMQTVGTFRPSPAQATMAANWNVGIAALLAMQLAAWPMAAATPLTATFCLANGAAIVTLGLQAWLNLRWARHLRQHAWTPPDSWHFSIRELLILTLACALATGGYRLADQQMRTATNSDHASINDSLR